MSKYTQNQMIAVVLRALIAVTLADLFLPPVGLNLAWIEWLGLYVVADVVLTAFGFAFGSGQAKATIVETEQYAQGPQ